MTIIGNGMIARSFISYNIENICIFASGISNSIKINEEDCKREYRLLKNTVKKNKKVLIYFSTTSVNNSNTLYVKHKIKIEKYITNNTKDYIILRLPNVVGKTKNKYQLLPYMYDKLINKQNIIIKKNVYRDLLDVDDIPKIVDYLMIKKIRGIINVSLNNIIEVIDIVKYLGKINNITPKVIEEECESSSFTFDKSVSDEIILSVEGLQLDPYKIIHKYYRH